MRRSFSISKKLQILAEQERDNASNSEICRRYDIQFRSLKLWKEKREEMLLLSKVKKTAHKGRPSKYKEHEDELNNYIIEMRSRLCVVNIRSIIRKLESICEESRECSFESKRMWVYRFLNRNKFSIRRPTRSVVIADDVVRHRTMELLSAVENVYSQNHDTIFINMDQTSVMVGLNARTTVHSRGESSVQVRTDENPNDRITVALTVASNGDKLSPFVIFRGTERGRIVREFRREVDPYPVGIEYACQMSAWMTESIMLMWIERILIPYVLSVTPERVCLILDSFLVHRKESIKARLEQAGIRFIYIPGGLTKDFQPLDVGINGPFKHWLREYSVENPLFYRRSASEKRHTLALAIQRSWNSITRQCVENSFNRILLPTLENIEEGDEIE